VELKEYQQKTLDKVKQYLETLAQWRQKALALPDAEIDFPVTTWEKVRAYHPYHPRKDGMGRSLPNFCLKIPTGGGKTLLAVKAIDLINTTYRRKQTGLILWIVPTTQIYNQTIKNLRDREHPYRQQLDIASAGKTLIREKTDRFTPLDVEENLIILMLMLPSASRQNKETLKMFKDSGGFQSFFPAEDDVEKNRALLAKIPNLDTFEKQSAFWGYQLKTSLGNALRLLSPVIILDEGHKAYSETAQATLYGFNPSMIVELSATPSEKSNILVDIHGAELNREEMIKLDLHIINKASTNYKDTLLAGHSHLEFLTAKAKEYHANSGVNIRPICLIQVERTGRDQRTGKLIHSEDVREHLIKIMGISPDEIAVKTSDKDELKEVDDVGGLMSPDCKIRYIITKQALQEGWDCAFAYILTILTNPSSKTAMTQLVGRILRQPYAKKTKVKELDESYVFCYQQKGAALMEEIRKGFSREGLGDLAGRVVTEDDTDTGLFAHEDKVIEIRDCFRTAASNILLPVFVVKDGASWRPVNYEMDIASRIPWEKADLKPLFSLSLSFLEEKDIETVAALSEDEHRVIEQKQTILLKEGGLSIDSVFLTRHLVDIVSNPWIAYEFGKKVIQNLLKKNEEKLVANNFVFIIEEMRKHLASESNRLAEMVFMELLDADKIRFWIIGENIRFNTLPQKKKIKASSVTLAKRSGLPLEKSLFDFIPDDDFNDFEKKVAWYLEDQQPLLFWYRNMARQDYFVQGWQKNKIYPDFIFTNKITSPPQFDRVFVVETKGTHLAGNPDTEYKTSVFKLCNQLAQPKSWSALGLELPENHVSFHVIAQDEWEQKFNEIFLQLQPS
jgi:type III restriction enzyme